MPYLRDWPIQSLDELAAGKTFPPEREAERYRRMERFARYSDRVFNGLVREATNDGVPTESQFRDLGAIGLRIQANMFRFVTQFWQDAVISYAPTIEYEGGGRPQDFIDSLLPGLVRATENVVVDLIRYGSGVYLNKILFKPQAVDTRFWFPVREGDDLETAIADVIAMPWSSNTRHEIDRITFHIYQNGTLTTRRHSMDGLNIGSAIGGPVERQTITDPIVPVRYGEGFYGTSDFEDIEDYVADLHRRESSVSEALDKQANPHLALPEGSFTVNENGTASINLDGMAIPVPDGAEIPRYVTWDASFEAQESAMERAELRILQSTAIAPILVRQSANVRVVASGATLRRLAIPTVNKIRRIRDELDPALRRVIVAQAELQSASGERVTIDSDAINITWPPELSSGVAEDMEAGVVAEGDEPNARTEENVASGDGSETGVRQ